MRLKNKVALITGAAMGMGEGTARVFAQEGATVILLDFSDKVFDTATHYKQAGYSCEAYKVDVRDQEYLKKIFAEVYTKYKRIDILVNVAGLGTQASFFDANGQLVKDMMDINFGGTWNTCQVAIPYMLKNNYGKIVNFASVTGVVVVDPSMSAYAATKGAVMALTKGLAVEFAPKGITVNAILPGVINTPMMQNSCLEANPEDPQSIMDAISQTVPTGRMGTIEEAGKVALFLASDDSSYVTGTSIVFDGGSTLPESGNSGWQPAED